MLVSEHSGMFYSQSDGRVVCSLYPLKHDNGLSLEHIEILSLFSQDVFRIHTTKNYMSA